MNHLTQPYNFDRFIQAQEGLAEGSAYSTALAEIKNGIKRSDWMWYIFPQVSGLGKSSTAQKYAIETLSEAQHFLAHPILGNRLLEITQALHNIPHTSPQDIFGFTDAQKLRSSMTLFQLISGRSEFERIINHYYDGSLCMKTVAWHKLQNH